MMKKNKTIIIKYMPIGLSIGLIIGWIVGAIFYNANIGLCLGVTIGMWVGWFIDYMLFIKPLNIPVFIENKEVKPANKNM